MIGYRSIGLSEFEFLINSENPVYGSYKYSKLKKCGCTLPYGVVCFYTKNIKWHDAYHSIDIIVNLSDDTQIAISTYMASKDFGKTNIFTGREGKTEYKVEEAYTRYYEPSDIIEINLHNHYTDSFIEKTIIPFCKKYNISLIRYNWKTGKEEYVL